MPTNTASRAQLPVLIAAWVLVAIIALIGSGLAGNAHAQAQHGAIPSLTLHSTEPGQLIITWETPEQAPTDYRIRWANSSMGFLSYKDSNEAQRGNVYPAGGVTTLTLNGLTPGENYKVQLRARYYNADRSVHERSGPWTATATFQVMEEPEETPPPEPTPTPTPTPEPTQEPTPGSTPGPTLPAAPTGLTASQVSHDSLALVWDDPQDENVTGYRVMRGTHNDSLLTIEANTGSASTEYTDTTVTAETTYFYAVLSLSADGDGPQSSTVNVTTSAEPQVDLAPPPTDLTTTRVTHDSLTLTWNAPRDTTVSGYRILRGTTYEKLSTIEDDTKNTNTQYTDSGLSEATTYFYAVNALTPDGQSSRTHLEANTPAELINAQPALSNDPATQTLISNMDRTTAIMQSTITRDLAQEFKTGTNLNKYKLSSIDLFLTGYSSPETVKIYHGVHQQTEVTVGTGSFLRPEVVIGDLVATMTTSSWSQGHDVYTFTSSEEIMLDTNTSYWIVVKDNGNPWFMAAPGEDVTPAQGWTISDKYQYRSKYRWDEDGNRLTNTDPAFRTTNGSLTIRINRVNNAATGVPTISGTPQTQQTLTASAADIQDDDGLPVTFNYQWMRYSADGTTFETNIGTNSKEYLLVLDDERKRIRVGITGFIDGKDNDEGPFLSDPYPADNTITAPLIYTMVSNTGRTPDSNRSVNISTRPHSQSFTTSSETAGYIMSSATILSIDPEGDEFAVKICEVHSNAPTTSCTDLTPPTSFAAGTLVFNSPSNRTITLSKATTYALVFSTAAETSVNIPVTAADIEDPITLPGWSIRNKSQHISNNQWMDRGHDNAYLIAIKGEPSQINQASGRPTIVGNPSVGQVLTTTIDSITVPEGVVANLSYQWKRLSSNGFTFEADIGTNSNQYTLTSDDLDKKFQVEVKFVETGGHVIGFPLTSPAYPPGRAISTAPSISNTSQNGNSNAPISEVAQSFTTGPSPHGYQPSRFTIFYDDEERRDVNLKICETSSGGNPTADCWNLEKPAFLVPGSLDFTVPDTDFHILNPNTTYAVVVKGPKPRTVTTTIVTACPQTDPDFTESCVHEVMVTIIVAVHVGVTTSNREDTLSSPAWSIGNAYQQNNEGIWQDVSSGESIRVAIHAGVAPNKDATGTPIVIGTARVGQTLTATTDNIGDLNGLPSQFAYQWKRLSSNGFTFEADIGTNSNQYTLTSDDLDNKIKVEVSYTDLGNYHEGPLTSEDYPQGTIVITTEEDDLLNQSQGGMCICRVLGIGAGVSRECFGP